jgi:hypothetical protein
MALFLKKFPFNDKLIILKGENAGKATDELSKWSESLNRQVVASPVAPEPATELPDVSANDSGTLGGTFVAGMYRVNAYREVMVQDPVSSSLAITLTWTHNAKAMTRTLSAFGGAPQVTTDSASDVEIIEIDPGTTIGYTLTYASNTPGLARFQITLLAELLQTLS